MNYNNFDLQNEVSESGYNPNIQVTTGTYCVTINNSQSSDKSYSEIL